MNSTLQCGFRIINCETFIYLVITPQKRKECFGESIKINSNNPDPIEISIQSIENQYRVIYWDGYAVNEFYDYANLKKALKKFNKFTLKAFNNIQKFGVK